ncbi:MAG: hypothetical protein E7634_02485 [Ruminococcaceae bacterium]|nr:hypothetical protein [Oscillospiraceae bacterium]
MLKLLHLADLHLDSPFKNLSYTKSVRLRALQREVFSSALKFARQQDCAAVLISGDLFDSEFYTSDTVTFLQNVFAEYSDIRFIISPGNHDPYRHGSPYKVSRFSDNVYIFTDEELSCLVFPEISLNVYGYAFTSPSYSKDPIEDFTAESSGFNVLCAHSDIDSPLGSYAYISPASIENSRLDYIALGHIHTKTAIMKKGSTCYAYSGCIAGRDFSEYGEKGGILVTLSEQNGEKDVKAERVTFCPWVYKTESVSLEGASSQTQAEAVIRQSLSDDRARKAGYEYITRLTLSGNLGFELDEKLLLSRLSELAVTEIENSTFYFPDEKELLNDYSVKGQFYKKLHSLLSSDDPAVRKRALTALRLGLKALSGSDVTIDD